MSVQIHAASRRQRRTQQERREEAEERLLHSALQLVSRKGVAGMTLGEVGELAGYSRGLPAHHFGNKEGLLRALASYIRQRFSNANLTRTPKPRAGIEAILSTVTLYLQEVRRRDSPSRAFHAIITEATIVGGTLQEDVHELNRMTLEFLEAQVRMGMQQGEIRSDIDPRAQAVVIVGMLRGIVSLTLIDSSVPTEAVREQALKNIRDALAVT